MSFQFVETSSLKIDGYARVAPQEQMERIRSLGLSLDGARVVHLNSTAVGGGVAEILKSMVPLMDDSGPDASWMVLEGAPEFFEITKRLHNLLQGAEGSLSKKEYETYVGYNERLAKSIKDRGVEADVWVLHDPQTLPLASFLPEGSKIIWVCHIDTTLPNQRVIKQLAPLMQKADRVVFSLPQYVVDGLDTSRVRIIPPAIDPLTTKNKEPKLKTVRDTLSRIGLDPDRPMMSQVARFDRWKDPWGVIDAYRMVKESVPDVQLALLGVIEAIDDPEAYGVLDTVVEYAKGDSDIHLFSDVNIVGEPEVSAVQKGAEVIIQKSLREGFGLSVAEAMWKGTPVIGGNCGGIRIQIEHGRTGFLVDTVEECATAMLQILKDPKQAKVMGKLGREHVRQKFLMTRILGDYLSVCSELLAPSSLPDMGLAYAEAAGE
ncbi:MAG: glycosyltransferase [Chloroflexi bacterium]|nr:glycosyltransferase [Chloroflexota bacterium]